MTDCALRIGIEYGLLNRDLLQVEKCIPAGSFQPQEIKGKIISY